MTESNRNELELFARLMAIQAGVVALLRTTNNPALAGVLNQEIEKVRSIFLANQISDECIDAFEMQLVPILKAVT